MYSATKSIYVDFSHFVPGHDGPCAGNHGHTFKFEVRVQAKQLNSVGFVVDFSEMRKTILQPIHDVLDHCFLVENTACVNTDFMSSLMGLSNYCSMRRVDKLGKSRSDWVSRDLVNKSASLPTLPGLTIHQLAGMKVVSCTFIPTSEGLAKWLWDVAQKITRSEDAVERGLTVAYARVYEQLHPVETYAEYSEPALPCLDYTPHHCPKTDS